LRKPLPSRRASALVRNKSFRFSLLQLHPVPYFKALPSSPQAAQGFVPPPRKSAPPSPLATNNSVLAACVAPLSERVPRLFAWCDAHNGNGRTVQRCAKPNQHVSANTSSPSNPTSSRQVGSFPSRGAFLPCPPPVPPSRNEKLHRPLLKQNSPWVRIPHAPNPYRSSAVRALANAIDAWPSPAARKGKAVIAPDRIGRFFFPLS